MRFPTTTALLAVGIVATLSIVHATGGYCPDPRVMRIICDGSRTVENCTQDSECSEGKKCCPSPCGWTECFVAGEKPPTDPKSGECAPSRREVTLCLPDSMENSTAECSNDWDCSGNLKCCEQACVKNQCKPPDFSGGETPREPKPGVCIVTLELCVDPSTRPEDSCETDYDCKDTDKCCKQACGDLQCSQAAIPDRPAPKSGECAPSRREVTLCLPGSMENSTAECSDDWDCSDDLKCCEQACVKNQCKPPVVEKAGMCMMHAMGCGADEPRDRIECDTDGDCFGSLKCCPTRCFGSTCQRADPSTVPTKAGECEYVPWELIDCAIMPIGALPNCTSDYECPGEQKCCDVACQPQGCRDPVIVKPGQCMAHVMGCPDDRPHDPRDCEKDADCEGDLKCCPTACFGKSCQRPDFSGGETTPKPAPTECPVYNRSEDCTTKKYAHQCDPEQPCSTGGRCCEIECSGTRCETDLCPVPEDIQCVQQESRDCEKSADCGDDKICCGIHCGGTRCLPRDSTSSVVSRKLKPGECERVEWERISCPEMPADAQPNCTNDFDCPGQQKCCDFPCAPQRCRDPAKKGQCPDFSMVKVKCPAEPLDDTCAWDSDCAGETKCCRGPCGNKACWEPTSAVMPPPPGKEGMCEDFSNIKALCIEGAYENSTAECNNDWDCQGSHKCCPQLCVKPLCKPPLKAGTCPMTIQGCSGEMPGPQNCDNDYNCTGELKCCTDGCGGRNCVTPNHEVHAGECPMFKCQEGLQKVDECRYDDACPYSQKCCATCTGFKCYDAFVAPPSEKEGVCIATREQCADPSTRPDDSCKTDYNCNGTDKCCKQSCGDLQCVPAAIIDPPAQKPGVCIRILIACLNTTGRPDDTCQTDFDCNGTDKCCEQPCGNFLCAPAHDIPTVHPGECPATPIPSGSGSSGSGGQAPGSGPIGDCAIHCETDANCTNGYRCCSNGCGKDCLDTGRADHCPEVLPPPPSCPNTCVDDSSCASTSKCCDNDCGGKQCYDLTGGPDPAPRPEYICPYYDPNRVCIRQGDQECNDTTPCGDGSPCCPTECGGTKCGRDLCPAPDPNVFCAAVMMGRTECNASDECGSDSICCSTVCGGRTCVKTEHPGTCPNTNGTAGVCAFLCHSDTQCAPDQKCCTNGCGGTNCMAAAGGDDSSNPKQIGGTEPEPQPEYICPYYDPKRVCVRQGDQECNETTPCDDGSPCCPTECGGTKCGRDLCPAPDPRVRCGLPEPQRCNSTTDCGEDSICCSTICDGRKCVKKAHPGSCPNTTGTIGLCAILCHGDYKCGSNEKCCTNGCGGTQCMTVVGGDDSSEPKPAPSECPVYNRNADCKNKRYAYQCDPKQPCSTGGRCCEIECSGTRCETDLCPVPQNIQCFAPETRDCETTADCKDDTKICCGIHCGGTRCLPRGGGSAPGNTTTGDQEVKQVQRGDLVCPAPDSKVNCVAVSRRSCSDDSACGNKKCCPSGCTSVNICKTPVRQGQCPFVDPSVIRCAAPSEQDKANACGTDMGCPGNQKCCPHGCPGYGDRCKDPVA